MQCSSQALRPAETNEVRHCQKKYIIRWWRARATYILCNLLFEQLWGTKSQGQCSQIQLLRTTEAKGRPTHSVKPASTPVFTQHMGVHVHVKKKKKKKRKKEDASSPSFVQCCFTSTETVGTIRDGEPRATASSFTQLLSSVSSANSSSMLLNVHRDRTDYLGRGAQDVRLFFRTPPQRSVSLPLHPHLP